MKGISCGLALVAALIVGVLVAGCGGGNSTTETAATISNAEFVAKGNAVCVKVEKTQEDEFNAFAKKHNLESTKPSQAQEVELAETVFVPSVQSQIDGIKALGAPNGEEQQVSSALELAQKTLGEIETNPKLAFSGDAFAAAGAKLHALGLKECAPNS